jgi:glycosyltransferase involved in cell wall biosynthesis
MRVALVNPAWSFAGSIYFGCREPHLPLEYGYAAALLRGAGHAAEIFEAQAEGLDQGRLAARVRGFAPDMIVAKNLALLDDIAADLAWPVEIAGEMAHREGGVPSFRHARVLGALGPGEMARRLSAAAIFTAPARYEPFGLGILEAAAAGCGLVLADIASLRGAAVFVPADDAPGGGWRSPG